MKRLAILGAALLASAATVHVRTAEPQTPRQTMVHAMGAHVMPFDLDKTLHRFEPTPAGGIETVTARDPKNSQQIAFIRMHLQHEASRFSTGDFSDPAAIHGKDMPGLAQISAGAAKIRFDYEPQPDGARIVYETTAPTLVSALHDWFKAQTQDHGRDAMP